MLSREEDEEDEDDQAVVNLADTSSEDTDSTCSTSGGGLSSINTNRFYDPLKPRNNSNAVASTGEGVGNKHYVQVCPLTHFLFTQPTLKVKDMTAREDSVLSRSIQRHPLHPELQRNKQPPCRLLKS